jgi:DNA-binding transcriptional regulator YiaG
MARARNPLEAAAITLVTLRGARNSDASAKDAAMLDATRELEEALAEKENFSKAEAARLLEVSAPTLEKWVAAGLLPVEQTPDYKHSRVPAKPLLELAASVRELRLMGRKRHLLVEALSRLEQEDPAWRAGFDELYGPALAASDEYVSAAPGPDWDAED